MPNARLRLRRSQAGLVVVDMQERLLPAMHQAESVVQNVTRLARAVALLRVPVCVTEQYRKGLGPTVQEIAESIVGFAPLAKTAFSVCGAPGFLEALGARGISEVILCGIESHVCVLQSCLELLERGLKIFIVADATTSRTLENHGLAIERMREAGGIIVSTEMLIFELLERAGTDEFRKILPLIK
jgi:nicotinamidase-related amidase